ncbi:ABC transporter permease [candidate division KSB1 bacterium]
MTLKTISIIKREYLTRVRSKYFIISTFFIPVLMLIIFGGIFTIGKFFKSSTRSFYVIDQSGRVFDEFTALLQDTLAGGEPEFVFTEIESDESNLDNKLDEFKSLVVNNEIDGYLVIPENILQRRRVNYSARSVGNIEEQAEIRGALSTVVTNLRFEERGLSSEEIQKEFEAGLIEIESVQITTEGAVEKSSETSNRIATFFVFMMYMVLVIYGQMLMNSVIEDKTQRVSETVLSSIRPFELMLGKNIGISMLGVTQLFIYGIIMFAGINLSESFFPAGAEILQTINELSFSPAVIFFLLIYFLMGFIFYASIYGAVGAMVSTEDEGKQMQIPITLFIVVAFFIALISIDNPEAHRTYLASLIPFFTPIVMIARIAATDPILPEGTFLSIIILFVSIIIMTIFSSRIFRTGILMYGKKASLKEALKWLRYK